MFWAWWVVGAWLGVAVRSGPVGSAGEGLERADAGYYREQVDGGSGPGGLSLCDLQCGRQDAAARRRLRRLEQL